ncbi:MAG: DUF962 domain-containing protein [Alphaproteobacteria bacterium]|nr:DUF962 domain-containing protein [Alphaproteobacteria bacterium]
MNFNDFWILYLKAHKNPMTRFMHYIATVIGILGGIVSLWTLSLHWVIFAILIGIVLAILSHLIIENNKPLFLINPFYGALSDLRMFYLFLGRRLKNEYLKHNIEYSPKNSSKNKPIIL